MSDVLKLIMDKDPEQKEFHQSVQEVIETVQPDLYRKPEYGQAKIL
jgi:glutamate dehydrogenase (NADP+)